MLISNYKTFAANSEAIMLVGAHNLPEPLAYSTDYRLEMLFNKDYFNFAFQAGIIIANIFIYPGD
jgi:hypothetical protein